MRLSAPELAARYRAGLTAEGAHVLDAGMVGTEMLYYLVGSRDLDGGLMCTASHNPKAYTGVKLVREGALAGADHEIEHLGADHPGVEHVRALGHEAGPVARGQLRRGQAHVAPEPHPQVAGRLAREVGEHARERPPDALGDVAVDLVPVEAADVVGLEDLGRWSGQQAAQDTLPRPMLEKTRDAMPTTPAGKGAAKVIVVMPARNAAKTLEATVDGIPKAWVDEIILVDDASTDSTVELARSLPVHLIWHPHNVGYGGNQKTCYLEALQRDADVVVMLHPDGQYEPEIIPKLVAPIVAGTADIVLGSRFLDPDGAKQGGMPWWKRAANRFLTGAENRLMGTDLSELHTGYRAFSRKVLLEVPFLRNSLDFAFDTELLMQASHFGFRFHEVPCATIYNNEASSVSFRQGVVYGVKSLGAGARLVLHRRGIWRSKKFQA